MGFKYQESATEDFSTDMKMDEESLLENAERPHPDTAWRIYRKFIPDFNHQRWDSVKHYGPVFQDTFQRLWESINLRAALFHILFMLSYAAIIYIIMAPRVQDQPFQSRKSVIYTPAEVATVPEAKIISVVINETSNIYNGNPSPEVDQAWSDLFQHANIRVPKEELDRTGRSSILLADGSGDYFGSLDVYHQLHCLKYIRHYVHQDYYNLGKTNVPSVEHVNHCIEMLRQVIMCKADTALMTYEWLPDFSGPWPNFGIQHECVNWDRIDSWSKARSIDVFDPQFLQHPTLGFSYAHLSGLPSSDKKDE